MERAASIESSSMERRANRISRSAAAWILASVTAFAFAIRFCDYRVGLPDVFHSDYPQVGAAAQLLLQGNFVDVGSYPATHVYFYAGAYLLAYVGGVTAGAPWAESWRSFCEELSHASLQHSVARTYTAAMGALLCVAAYRLSRVRFSRNAALLAAGCVSVCPGLVIYSHQARIHVPGITLLVFAAAPALRCIEKAHRPSAATSADARLALRSGIGAGFVASIFQLGILWLVAYAGLVMVLVRPMRRAAELLGRVAVGAVGVATVVYGLAHLPGVVNYGAGFGALDNLTTLGIPSMTLGFRFIERAPEFVAHWIAAEPVRVAFCAAFLIAAWKMPQFRRDVLLYGLYPLAVLLVLGTNYVEVRYSLSVLPFVAPWIAAVCLMPTSVGIRVTMCVAVLAAGLLSSTRYLWLIHEPDTRQEVRRLMPALSEGGASVAIEASLLHGADNLPSGVSLFPPKGDFKPWYFDGVKPSETLSLVQPDLLLVADAESSPIQASELTSVGFRRVGILAAAPRGASFVPDAPSWLFPDLWRSSRRGPSIDLWARTPTGFARAVAVLRPTEAGPAVLATTPR